MSEYLFLIKEMKRCLPELPLLNFRLIDWMRQSVLSGITRCPAQKQSGFKGYLLLVDRSTGKGITITLWEGEEDRQITGPNSNYLSGGNWQSCTLTHGRTLR